MLDRLCPFPWQSLFSQCCTFFSTTLEKRLDGLVRDEEEGGAWSGTDKRGTDAGVDALEAARAVKAGGGLKAGFEGVDGVEGKVDGGSCERAGLKGVLAVDLGNGAEIW